MNDAAACETDSKCFIVGVTKLDKARLFVATQYFKRLCYHGAFDATATH
jgi:hypothetical protein